MKPWVFMERDSDPSEHFRMIRARSRRVTTDLSLHSLALLLLGSGPVLRLLLLPQTLLLGHEAGLLFSAPPLLRLAGHGLFSEKPEGSSVRLAWQSSKDGSISYQLLLSDLLLFSCSSRSCSSLSRCSRARLRFSASTRAASSGSLVPAEGLLEEEAEKGGAAEAEGSAAVGGAKASEVGTAGGASVSGTGGEAGLEDTWMAGRVLEPGTRGKCKPAQTQASVTSWKREKGI